MSAACQFCDDTGSLSKQLIGYLDCTHCDVAGERVNFEARAAHAKLLGGGVIDAWQLYQMGKAAGLEMNREAIVEAADEWARYVEVDTAPRSLGMHMNAAITEIIKNTEK